MRIEGAIEREPSRAGSSLVSDAQESKKTVYNRQSGATSCAGTTVPDGYGMTSTSPDTASLYPCDDEIGGEQSADCTVLNDKTTILGDAQWSNPDGENSKPNVRGRKRKPLDSIRRRQNGQHAAVHASKKHQQGMDRILSGAALIGNLTRRLMSFDGDQTSRDVSHGERDSTTTRPRCSTTIAQQLEANYDELWVRSTRKRDKKQLFYVIPGNPGVTRAYAHFAKLLCLRFNSDVCVVSHLGHCSFSTNVFGVESQISHHHRVIRKHSRDYSSVVLLGHSIGGYFALNVAESTDEIRSKLNCVGVLAPVVSRFAPRGYWYVRIATNPIMRFLLYLIAQLCPSVALLMSEMSKELINEIRGGKFLNNILYLSADEINELPKEVPRQTLVKWGVRDKKLFVVYAQEDKYVTHEIQRQVKYCAEDPSQDLATVVSLKSLNHSFPIHSSDCAAVVELMSDYFSFGGFTTKTVKTIDKKPSTSSWSYPSKLFACLLAPKDSCPGLIQGIRSLFVAAFRPVSAYMS